MHAHGRTTEPIYRLFIQALGVVSVAQQRAQTGLYPKRPISGGGASRLLDALECVTGPLGLAAANGRFDQLGQRPDGRTLCVKLLCRSGRLQGGVVTTEPV